MRNLINNQKQSIKNTMVLIVLLLLIYLFFIIPRIILIIGGVAGIYSITIAIIIGIIFSYKILQNIHYSYIRKDYNKFVFIIVMMIFFLIMAPLAGGINNYLWSNNFYLDTYWYYNLLLMGGVPFIIGTIIFIIKKLNESNYQTYSQGF